MSEFIATYVGMTQAAFLPTAEPVQHIFRGGAVQGTASTYSDVGTARADVLNGLGERYAARAGVHVIIEGRPASTGPDYRQAAVHQILDLYSSYGVSLFDRIAGDFAIAIVDTVRRRVMLGLDRMGIRAMYFALTPDGRIFFGPHGSAIASHPLVQAPLSRQALFDFMNFHMVPSPGTVFSGVQKLRRAHVAVLVPGKAQVQRYWSPAFSSSATSPQAVELKDRLRVAVERCQPDERTGAFLSGGLDSSTVAGMLGVVQGRPARTFSIGFGAEGYDELAYARLAVRHFQADGHEAILGPQHIVEAIPLIAAAYDEPFGNSSAVPTYFCARLARSAGVNRLLAGDGGDEIFGGNGHYSRQLAFEWYWRIPRWLRPPIMERLVLAGIREDAVFPFGKLRSYIEQARIPLPLRLRTYDYMFRHDPADIFDPEFLHGLNVRQPAELMTQVYDEAKGNSVLDRLLYYDWEIVLADNDLRKVGRMCEMAGVEVHYPMLDCDLVEFATQIPAGMKVRGQELRYFFKKAMADFLPREIITKTKHGFGLPFGVWLKTSKELQDIVYGSIRDLMARGIFRRGFLDDIIREHREGHASIHGYVIWDLVMLQKWMESHPVSM